MQTAIMQPYFLPYLGYFQLITAADVFVVYDTIQYTKKGWINRNRMLRNGEAVTFSIPLKKDSDYLNVAERQVADAFDPRKLCSQIEGAYRKAPEFNQIMPLVEKIMYFEADNLFDFVQHSIRQCCDYMGITTPLQISSQVENGPSKLQGAQRVIDICKRVGATGYINPPGGRELYAPTDFRAQGLELRFLQPRLSAYPQFGDDFIPSLSILDVMMFNSANHISTRLLREYDLVE
ncbi:MAG: WbqC family protein [Pseudomonadota bacterium]